MKAHDFVPLTRPNERDVLRTVVCKRCTLRDVIIVSTGKSTDMTERFPDCDEFIALGVHAT